MRVLDEIAEQGVVEAPFRLSVGDEEVPGVLWRPEGVSGPTPTVLIGHGGTQHKRAANVLGLARRFVRHLGASAAALDAPGHGDRVTDPERARAARADLERRIFEARGTGSAPRLAPIDAEAWVASHERAAAEWRALLDALLAAGVADERVGYWGLSMGTMIGLPLLASEPRIACAVLGLASLTGWPDEDRRRAAAQKIGIPVLFVLQWDDQLMTREAGLELFDALGSADKAMHAFPGGHIDTPLYERDAYDTFFARHLRGGAGSVPGAPRVAAP